MFRRVVSGIGTGILVTVAVAIVGWVVFSTVTGATLLTFHTGSMSPTIPQGSLAIAVEVQAHEVEVGDVLTVQRGEGLFPVTHRVVEIRDRGTSARELILQGDDNRVPDARPYLVDEAHRVVVSVPRAGDVLARVLSPIGMTLLVAVAGALVMWALWPERKQTEPERKQTEEEYT